MYRRLTTTAFLVCGLGCFAHAALAESGDSARLVPQTTVAYAELSQPQPVVDALLSTELRQWLDALPAWRRYLDSDRYRQGRAAIALVEARLGRNWQPALADLVGGGVALAADPANDAAILVVRGRDRDLLTRLNEALAEMVAADARNRGQPSPVRSEEHRGVRAWTFGPEEFHAILDDVLVVSNKAEAIKQAIDRHQDPAAGGLDGVEAFEHARGQAPAGAIGFAWTDLEAVRKSPDLQKAVGLPSDNPLAELLLGGILDALGRAPFAAASLELEGRRVRLHSYLPSDPSQTRPERAWYFATPAGSAAQPELALPDSILRISMARDLAGMWSSRDKLFNEEILAGFAQADTQLGLFFSDRDFGPEVLGELEPQLQIIVTRQQFSGRQAVPAVKLPAMALVVTMKDPDDFATHLLVAYQKVVGLTNIVGGQQGQPQLLLATEEYHGATISKATYLAPAENAAEPVPVNYNFSPACARVGEDFVFGSTVEIVRQVVDALEAGGSDGRVDNLRFELHGEPLAAILDDNRELLITQNMLSEGHGRPEAEEAITAVLKLIRLAERAGFGLVTEPSVTEPSVTEPSVTEPSVTEPSKLVFEATIEPGQ